MTDVINNLENVRQRITLAAQAAQRNSQAIQLIAVSKTRSATEIHQAFEAGQLAFGENYLQEALPKIEALKAYPLEWHFIGAIQSNKTRPIAENFAWAHTVTHEKIAARLNAQRPNYLAPLNICIEVNVDAEETKTGVKINEILTLAEKIRSCDRLKLRGLMAIPAPIVDKEKSLASFMRLRDALYELKNQGFDVDTLSMGMSHDFELAIQAGATIIRVGTAIFGQRT